MKKILFTAKYSWKAFKEVITVEKLYAVLYFIGKNLVAFINIYNILILGKLIDSVAEYIGSNLEFIFSDFITSDIFKNFAALIGLHLLTSILNKLVANVHLHIHDFYWEEFQENMIRKVASLNLEDMEKAKVQDLLTQVQSYSWTSMINTFIGVTDLTNNIITFVSAGYVIANKMSGWGLAIILLVIPEAFVRYKYNVKLKQFRDANSKKQTYFEYLYSEATRLTNFPELRVDNVFNFFEKSFTENSEGYYEQQNKIRKKRDTIAAVLAWTDHTVKRIVQMSLIPISIAKSYSIGTFKYLFDYIDNMYSASWNLVWQSLSISTNALYIKDYFDFFEYQGFGDSAAGDVKLDKLQTPRIEFVNVDFKYPESTSATLDHVSFEIEPGEKVMIIGKDNSGKSTIAKLICSLYRVGPGDILINDVSIKNLSRGELKNKISVVFENYVKYNFSLRKNVTVTQSDRDFNRRLYEETLEITGLSEWINENLIDENQILGKQLGKGMEISSGHWQRVAIARALYRDRQILILDESLTQIDSFSRKPILENIIRHRPNQTFIHITQEEEHKSLFDKIIYIEHGKVKEVEKTYNRK